MKKKLLPIFVLLFGFLFASSSALAALPGANQAAAVLCDVILFIRGRYGRALALLMVMNVAISFMKSAMGWEKIAIYTLGIAVMFGAESIAYVILPSTVKGITGVAPSGKSYSTSQKYTPEEIVKEVCPELTRYGKAVIP